jgi:hypothetical protein
MLGETSHDQGSHLSYGSVYMFFRERQNREHLSSHLGLGLAAKGQHRGT